jgi:alpha-amylase
MTLHYTGPLWEWFEKNEPEFLDLLTMLVERSQIELMGGGFYEPIVPVIPEADAHDQIEYMSSYLENRFGVRPRGMWCAERIWEPGVPKKVAGSGIEYTLLDDSHFLSTGLSPQDIHGYYITEREGYPLKVFPIDMHLRYLIPFRQPHEVIEYLLLQKAKGIRVATYGDDGEKFGMWPGTFNWVIEQGWLRKFFDELLRASDQVEMAPLAEVVDRFPPNRLIYLPTASYQEMMEWSLFAQQGRRYEHLVKEAREKGVWESQRAFLRGGIWDNFLAKYPESNLMVKKGLKVSTLVREHGPSPEALRHLLMSQTNCPYWHGLFGGIYISYLRHAVYENLLTAESLVDDRRFGDRAWILERYDYDMDGREEVLVSGRRFNCYLSPARGVSAFAVEDKERRYNFSNILMRHEEIYHNQILNPERNHSGNHGSEPLSIHDISRETPEEFKKLLVYDTYPKYSFITHLLEGEPGWEGILLDNTVPYSLSADLPFEMVSHCESGEDLTALFKASDASLVVEKGYRFQREGRVSVSHRVESGLDDLWVGLEFNLMVVSGQRPLVEGRVPEEGRGRFLAREVRLRDDNLDAGVTISSDVPWEVLIVPIECVSQSEEGFERTFQGWSVYWFRKLEGGVPEVSLAVGGACPS